ncbi:MAG: hypothetical protein GY773_18775, partial [Actinomycetia bacterium]|nr:hypothetical protein [Actinomycetes bacterium]
GFGLLTDTRMASHANFDRFVLQFRDTVPAYLVHYAAPPFNNIPGNMVGVAGNMFLAVNLTGASTIDWEASGGGPIVYAYDGPTRIRTGTGNIAEALFVTDFEAEMEWLLGLAESTPFRVSELDDPPRLVIDVGHGTVTTSDVALQFLDGEGTGFGWLTNARLTGHEGFDRFVLEFSPDYQPEPDAPTPGLPGYEVHYVAGLFRGCEPPDQVAVAGNVFVLVDALPASRVDWSFDPPLVTYGGPERLTADTTNAKEAVLANDCLGVQWVIGLDRATAITVTERDDPPSLVVDIAH